MSEPTLNSINARIARLLGWTELEVLGQEIHRDEMGVITSVSDVSGGSPPSGLSPYAVVPDFAHDTLTSLTAMPEGVVLIIHRIPNNRFLVNANFRNGWRVTDSVGDDLAGILAGVLEWALVTIEKGNDNVVRG